MLEMGKCPICKKELKYGTFDVPTGDTLIYQVWCDCGWQGRELYDVQFTTQTDLAGLPMDDDKSLPKG